MKVRIGKYINHITVYTFIDYLLYIGFTDDKIFWIGEYLSEKAWVESILDKINEKRQRKIKIEIDDFDVWSADHTMALIIVPLLKKLKERKQGSALVDTEDVPDNIKRIPPAIELVKFKPKFLKKRNVENPATHATNNKGKSQYSTGKRNPTLRGEKI